MVSHLSNIVVLTVFLSFFTSFALAEDPPPLSPAELAALQHQEQVLLEETAKLCRHTLLYGSAVAKAELIEGLNGLTCEEAASTSPPEPENP